MRTVEQAGYGALLPRAARSRATATTTRRPTRPARCASGCWSPPSSRCRSIAMAMVPAWQFTNWQWLSLTLAAPVVVWGAWPFHRAAWTNLRHGTSTMDTLVSLGTLAACGWSLYALFWGTAGTPGMTHPFELTVARTDGVRQHLPRGRRRRDHLHPGRPLLRGPVQAARRSRAARAARAGRQGRRGAAGRPGGRGRGPDPDRPAGRRRPVRRTPGREDRHRRRRRGGQLRGRRLDAHRRVGAGRGRPGRRRRRRHRQRGRPAGRPRHARRLGHAARPDGATGRGRPERQGRRSSGSPTGSPASSCRS